MQGITTQVFDASSGVAAAGIPVRLEHHRDGQWHPAGICITDAQGRAHALDPLDETNAEPLRKGDYRLTFQIAAYFKARDIKAPYPFVQVTFTVGEAEHVHAALSLSPFGYSTHLES